MLKFNTLEYGYDDNSIGVIDGICFNGRLTALTGINGSGKSTLLKTIAGILSPISGNYEIFSDDNVKNCNISYIPQQNNFRKDFPISVYDFVLSAFISELGFLKGASKTQKNLVYKVLETVQLLEKIHININELSGGQFQRMVYARLLVENKTIILLDEPFSAIDEATKELLLKELLKLKNQNKTILVALHDGNMVNQYFDDLISLENGLATFNTIQRTS